MYVDDSALTDESRREQLHKAVAHHVTVLFRHIFLSVKPSKPAQSRWTGVASVANFTLSLALFHRMLAPLFASLTAKDGNSASSTVKSTDADARDSGVELHEL